MHPLSKYSTLPLIVARSSHLAASFHIEHADIFREAAVNYPNGQK